MPRRVTKVSKVAKGDLEDFGGSELLEPLLEAKSGFTEAKCNPAVASERSPPVVNSTKLSINDVFREYCRRKLFGNVSSRRKSVKSWQR